MVANLDPTDLRRQERDAEADEALARETRRRELEDLRWLLGHPQGRRITTRLLEEAGLYRTSFNHSGSVMAFNEGKRHLALFLTAELMEASTDGFMKVLKEYNRTNKHD
jgi:methylase of polypeptide subunit release factors